MDKSWFEIRQSDAKILTLKQNTGLLLLLLGIERLEFFQQRIVELQTLYKLCHRVIAGRIAAAQQIVHAAFKLHIAKLLLRRVAARRFELHLLFDYDKADIKAKDYPDLDTVAKVLARNPGATATIEGHADRRFASKADYNRRLSERRANAVKNYFIGKGIDASRLRAVGYGFDRPKVKPDLRNGTPENRRVEVYIRGADERGISDALKAK